MDRAVVAHRESQRTRRARRDDPDMAEARVGFYPVMNGILDQRLPGPNPGLQRIEHIVRDVDMDFHAIAKSSLLDFHVARDERHFIAQGDLLPCHVIDGESQEVAECGEDASCARDILRHEGGHGMQGVEKEVRL